MLNYKDYELIWDDIYIIGYKKDVVRYLKDNLKIFIDDNYTKDVLEEELERLTIVRDSKYDDDDLIKVKNNDEEKGHIPTKPIAKVWVLIPYKDGFSGNDVCKYLV